MALSQPLITALATSGLLRITLGDATSISIIRFGASLDVNNSWTSGSFINSDKFGSQVTAASTCFPENACAARVGSSTVMDFIADKEMPACFKYHASRNSDGEAFVYATVLPVRSAAFWMGARAMMPSAPLDWSSARTAMASIPDATSKARESTV